MNPNYNNQYQYPPQGYPPPPPAGYPPTTFQSPPGASYPQPYNNKPSYAAFNYAAQPPPQTQQPGYDPEAAHAAAYASAFIEQKVRSAFVRKVLVLVFLMLAFTTGVAAVFLFVQPVNYYVAGTPYIVNGVTYRTTPPGQWVFYTSWGLTLVAIIVLMCFDSIRRRFPFNYIALIFLTVVMSVQVGTICAWWNVQVVLMAVAVTGAAVLGLTLAAVFIPWDITKKGHVIGMASIVVFFIILMTMIVGFFYVNKWWYLAISVVVALLFSVYFVYDLQMILGNKQHKVGVDEWCYAATQLYLDIVFLFLNLLSIIGIASN